MADARRRDEWMRTSVLASHIAATVGVQISPDQINPYSESPCAAHDLSTKEGAAEMATLFRK